MGGVHGVGVQPTAQPIAEVQCDVTLYSRPLGRGELRSLEVLLPFAARMETYALRMLSQPGEGGPRQTVDH